MVDVDDVVDVVVLQHHRLAPDQRLLTGEVDRVERGPVVRVDGLVPEVHGVPVEPHVHEIATPLGQAGARGDAMGSLRVIEDGAISARKTHATNLNQIRLLLDHYNLL